MASDRIQQSQEYFIPEGLKDVSYTEPVEDDDSVDMNKPLDDDTVIDIGGEVQFDELGEWDESEESSPNLGIPDNLTIISQHPKMISGGGQVVDVILAWDDVPGVSTYEVRVTKLT